MPSTEAFPEHAIDPLAPVAQAAGWLAATATHLLLGLAIGLLIARAMRSLHLRWTWAGCAFALLALTRPLLGGSAVLVLAAAITATFSSRRAHLRDVQAGSDLAEIAARRSGPLDALRMLGQRLELRRRVSRGTLAWFRRDELIVGSDHAGRIVSVPCGGSAEGVHTLVVGSTGSGKTVTQTWLAVKAIQRGHGAIVIDPKGDPGLREQLVRAAGAARREFIEWTPTGPSLYNPYARGSETEIADKVLAGERFTEPHYLRQAQRYLGHVVRALRQSGREVSLHEIVQLLEPARLESLARTLPPLNGGPVHDYLDALTPRQQADLSGVRDRLAILAESDAGVWLDPARPCPQPHQRPPFDLLDVVAARAVVYFDLQADRRPLLTNMLGAAIVQDLITTVAALQQQPTPTLVVIDEFSAVAAEHVVRLFGRARSAGFSLVLGTQELSDLRPPGRERLLEQVVGNLSLLIAHRQVVPESAALIAELAGTRGAWRTTRHSDGRTMRTRTREGMLDAGHVMALNRGWAALIVLTGGTRSNIARIFSVQQHG